MKSFLVLALGVGALGLDGAHTSRSTIKGRQAAPTVDWLAREVTRVESVREVKDITATFAQLAQYGRWTQMARLFTDNGTLRWGEARATGTDAIEMWLQGDAAGMDGIRPGSLNTLAAANPLVNLAVDGRTAKARFNGWRFQGNGAGDTYMQGGIYENEYALVGDKWRISLLRYYPLYNGPYAKGWRNANGGNIADVPYHYTTDEAGIPIPPAVGQPPQANTTSKALAQRILALNDEDEVRNLQHAYGYYVDRRMWTDVVDLFSVDCTVNIENVGSFAGKSGARQAMEAWMGPEGLKQGILNEHLIFNTVVNVDGRQGLSRGSEIALLGDANRTAGWWQFNVFSNRFVKEDGVWKLKDLVISPLLQANYSSGWGNGSTVAASTAGPKFLEHARASRATPAADADAGAAETDLAELQRRLGRSAAYDGTENVSNAYGFYIDWIDGVGCGYMAAIHARQGHKESPFAGFYQTRERVLKACTQYYGTGAAANRTTISFHWRPQPVILVSRDGRSASVRARLLQPQTDRTDAGVVRGAVYHDQTNLEDGVWRLWSVTIDEFYWTVSRWAEGWAGVRPRAADAPNPAPRDLLKQYPPDLTLTDMGDPRETGFQGGSGRFVSWPEIQRMWFAYRNPVSGRVPESYWPGCVPCRHRPAWALTAHGYQEPPTGPTAVRAAFAGGGVDVTVAGGPGEPVVGTLRLTGSGKVLEAQLNETSSGRVTFLFPADRFLSGRHVLTATFLGSDRLLPGQASVVVTLP